MLAQPSILISCLFFCCISTIATAQVVDSILVPTDQLEQQAERLTTETTEPQLVELHLPLFLNTLTEADLQQLGLLSPHQIQDFLFYRTQYGPFISIYELQAIPSFSIATIQKIRPYIQQKTHTDDYHASLIELFQSGRRTFQSRWSQSWSKRQSTALEGQPFQLALRLRHQHSDKLSLGLQAEKDVGEPFFRGRNQYGFDFYSGHLFLKNYRQWLKAVAIGDYKLSLGQGLLIYQGFAGGPGSVATAIKKVDRKLAPHASTGESRYLRGLAAQVQMGKFHWTVFSSYKRIDSRIDTNRQANLIARSISKSGLHRNAGELDRKGNLGQWVAGQQVEWRRSNLVIGVNSLWSHLALPLIPALKPYNIHHFRGKSQLGLSTHYSFRSQNWHLFGEVARSQNARLAQLHGLLIGLGPKLDLALAYRNYDPAYQAFFADAFRAGTRPQDEEGFYLGIQIRPHHQWMINAYADIWQHTWLQFQADRPPLGRSYRIRLTYQKKRKWLTYLEIRDRVREENVSNTSIAQEIVRENTNYVIPVRRVQARFHHNHFVNARLELRTRLDFGFSDSAVHSYQRGFSAFQDVLYRPLSFPLAFTFRYAIFDTDSYQTRYYNYENNLLNTFSIPAYYNRGTRWYLNLRYKPIPQWTLEMRFAQINWQNPVDASDTENKKEVSIQVRYQVDIKKRR